MSESKDYVEILNDLFAEKEITKQEYEELKKKYDSKNSQNHYSIKFLKGY